MATPTEIALSALWETVLKTKDIGLDEDFFVLGGDSLNAAQLVMSVEEIFGVDLPLAEDFSEENSIRVMARKIDNARNNAIRRPVGANAMAGSDDAGRSSSIQTYVGASAIDLAQSPQQDIRIEAGPDTALARVGESPKSTALDFQTVPEAITAWAERTPNRIALMSAGLDPIAYGQLAEEAQRICHFLEANTVMPPQRVAVCVQDRPSLALCLIGLLFHGAPAIPVNPATTAEEFHTYLTKVQADAVICIAGEDTVAKAAGGQLGLTVVELERSENEIGFEFSDNFPASAGLVGIADPSEWALLLSTSGTTGRKSVPKTHGEMTVNVDQRAKWMGLGPKDRCLNVMPLYLSQGIYDGLLAPLYTGGSTILASSSDTEAFFTSLEVYRPTWYTAVYTFYRDILAQAPKYTRVIEKASLSFMKAGGMRFPQEDAEKIEALFKAPIMSAYGMTETGWIASEPLPPKTRKAGAVGLQVIDEVKLIDEQGESVDVGQTGEVVVRGPGVMKGYIDDPEANAQAFIDGWFRTGDLGHFDNDGFLTLTGRIKEMINRGSEKISPAEIEQVLVQHPNVDDIAIFAVPHTTLGEDVAAAIVFNEDQGKTSQDELREFALGRLTRSKVPRQIFPVSSIPRTPGGKPQRNVLVEQFARPSSEPPVAEPDKATHDMDMRVPLMEVPLIALWKSVLGTDSIDRHDRFSDLGGTEQAAAELADTLRAVFGVDLPNACLFAEGDTVAKMAAMIDGSPTLKVELDRDDEPQPDDTATANRRRQLIDFRDVARTAVLAVLLVVAIFGSPRLWRKLSSAAATLHVKLCGLQPDRFSGYAAADNFGLDPAELKQQLLAGVYADYIYTLREHLPGGWRPNVAISGTEHIDQALRQGRGAILWAAQDVSGDLVRLKALSESGFPSVFLSHLTHPYSDTVYGYRVLNRVRTRVEDRYLVGRAVVSGGDEVRALQKLRAHLRENGVVSIAAVEASGNPQELPFLDGWLRLGIGAAFLAARERVPVLPVFTTSNPDGAFEVLVEPPLQTQISDRDALEPEHLAARFAERLEAHVRRHPTLWRGWLTGGQWRAASD